MNEAIGSGIADAHGSTGFQVQHRTLGGVNVLPGVLIERGHVLVSTATEPLSVTAADASQTRFDRVVARVSHSANSVTLVVKTGTAGSPNPPTLTSSGGVYEQGLAILQRNPGTGTTVATEMITDERRFIGRAPTTGTTNTRPLSPRKGDMFLNLSLGSGQWEFYNGSSWVTFMSGQTAENSTKWGGYNIVVSPTTPSGSPTTDRIWFQPIS
jgi:hypothetical protein